MKNWIEKRHHKREFLQIKATAVMADGLLRQDVVVINLSRSGAMVELPATTELADSFTLLFNHSFEPCRVVWRHAQFVGLSFDAVLQEPQSA